MRNVYWRMGSMLLVTLALSAAGTQRGAFATNGAVERPTGFGTITGTVLDSRGKPLAGALVTVLRDGLNEVVRETRSAADGTFAARVTPGRYLIRALAAGFTPATFSSVQIDSSSELVYRFNLQPAGEGRTTPEHRADRHEPKFRIRSSQSRRSIFQAGEGEDAVVAAANEAVTGDEEAAAPVEDLTAPAEEVEAADAAREGVRLRRPRGVVETFFAASANPGAGTYGGVNFAVAAPVTRQFEMIFAGQLGEFERLEATARVRAGDRHRLSATLGGARSRVAAGRGAKGSKTPAFSGEKLGQLSVRAVDEWVVREGVVVVLGLDYARFVGAGDADSLSPRLGLEFDANARTRLRAAYAPGTNAATSLQGFQFEDGAVLFKESPGQAVAVVDGRPVMERSRRLEFGVERLLDESSSVEATVFFDTTDGRGVGLLSMPLSAFAGEGGAALTNIARQQGGARGVRVVYTRRLSQHLRASAGYAYGRGQELSPEGITGGPDQLFQDASFQTAAAQLDASVLDGTRVRTVVRFSPRAAVFAIDPFAGRLAVYDPSLSILVTQELPSFGLPVRAEATLDARNLLDAVTGVEDGESLLSVGAARRMVRGGISFRF